MPCSQQKPTRQLCPTTGMGTVLVSSPGSGRDQEARWRMIGYGYSPDAPLDGQLPAPCLTERARMNFTDVKADNFYPEKCLLSPVSLIMAEGYFRLSRGFPAPRCLGLQMSFAGLCPSRVRPGAPTKRRSESSAYRPARHLVWRVRPSLAAIPASAGSRSFQR